MEKFTDLKLNFKNLPRYLLASITMAVIIYITRKQIGSLPTKAIQAATPLIILVAMGVLIYGALLYLLSKDFREFIKELSEFAFSIRKR